MLCLSVHGNKFVCSIPNRMHNILLHQYNNIILNNQSILESNKSIVLYTIACNPLN